MWLGWETGPNWAFLTRSPPGSDRPLQRRLFRTKAPESLEDNAAMTAPFKARRTRTKQPTITAGLRDQWRRRPPTSWGFVALDQTAIVSAQDFCHCSAICVQN